MKKLVNKTKGLVRGTSTAVLLSVAIHAVLFFGAGVWVVFTIIDHDVDPFVAKKIDRPKMQLKKLRVKVKEPAKPRKTTQRIASARKSADLPDIQLPEMAGMGAGLEGAIGGFDMMADMSTMTIFGGGKSMGNDLEGTFYHFLKDRQGNPSENMTPSIGSAPRRFTEVLDQFLTQGWSPRVFDPYYRAPTKLYATHFMVPPCASALGPAMFGVDDDRVHAALWMIHYKGKIAHPTGGKFRFWGYGDNFLFVRVNGEFVLDGSFADPQWMYPNFKWRSSSEDHRQYQFGHTRSRVGDWFTLEPGVPVEMELLMGEGGGGLFAAMLAVQELGVDYLINRDGAPILPIFKTTELPVHILDEIKYKLIPGEVALEGGPVFSVY